MDSKYWEGRKAQQMFEHMQAAEETAEQIAKLYQKASGYTSGQMDKIYNRYKRKYKLSDKEAMQLLNAFEDPTSLLELKQVLKRTNSTKEKDELRAILESPAYRTRLDRLQQLQSEIDVMMHQVYKQEKMRSTSHYITLANDAYYKGIYNVQVETGLGFAFDVISPKQIDTLLNSQWSGMNYSERIWHNTQGLAKDIKRELLINLMTGRTDREAAEILSNKFGTGAYEARRLIRTESAYVANEMEAQSYEKCEIEEYTYIATLDMKTSKQCQEHDQKSYKVKERKQGMNYPPLHPWCRSTTIMKLDKNTMASLKRRARDPETGKTYKVAANTSYPEWHKEHVYDTSKAQNTKTSAKDYEYVGKIGESKSEIEREFGKLSTNEVVLTNERRAHVNERHPETYETFLKGYTDCVQSPDIILKDGNHDNTVLMIKDIEGEQNLNLIVKLSTVASEGQKNSIITGYCLSDKRLKRMCKKNKVVYMKNK